MFKLYNNEFLINFFYLPNFFHEISSKIYNTMLKYSYIMLGKRRSWFDKVTPFL